MADALLWRAGVRAASFLATLLLTPGMAAALDCTAPRNSFLRNVCEDPGAFAEWHKMEQTLQDTLAVAPDPSTKDVIQASQDRWLEMMGGWDVDATRAALAMPDDDSAEIDSTDPVKPANVEAQLVEVIAYRSRRISSLLKDFSAARARFSHAAEIDPPGLVALSDTECFFVEPEVMRGGYWDTFCGGTVSLQKGPRICSVMTYWYSGHINMVYSVDDLLDGKLIHRGNCDWNGSAPDCPDVDDGSADNPHWDLLVSDDVKDIHKLILNAGTAQPSPLSPIDPEAWPDVYPADWFSTCLSTPDYPPPDQVWSGPGPKP